MSLQLSGLAGGLVATAVMTAFMLGLGDDSPPPTALLVAKFAGGDPEQYLPQGMALHLLYGTGAGWVFALLAEFGLLAIPRTPITNGAINGLAYGLLLMIPAVVWMRGIIGIEPDPREMGLMVGFHAVYGIVLGAFVGAGLLV